MITIVEECILILYDEIFVLFTIKLHYPGDEIDKYSGWEFVIT